MVSRVQVITLGRHPRSPEPRDAHVYHVQTVNSYHERLKTTLNRVRRGVATKYMPNYLAWTRLDEWYKGDLKPEYFVISALGRQLINT